MITIRSAGKEDFLWILDLNRENEIWLTPLDEELLSALADSAHIFLLAEADGQPVAFMIALRENNQVCQLKVYQWFNERYSSFLYIDRLVTHETFRGQGIGRLLYEKAVQKALEDQVPVLAAAIETIPYNERSLGFHKAMGFEEAGRILVRNETVEVSLQTKALDSAASRLARIRDNEKKSHTVLYTSEKLYDSDSWLHKPVKTVQELADHFAGHQDLRVLDLGCGVGRNSIYLAERFRDISCAFDCVDLLDVAIEKLMDNARERGVSKFINGIARSIEDYEIKPASYDLILAVSALEHVESEAVFRKKLAEIREGIREKGIVCLIINSDARERRADTNELLEAQFEVNLPSDTVKEILNEIFQGWEVLKSTVIHQEYDIPRDNFISLLHTHVVTFAARKL